MKQEEKPLPKIATRALALMAQMQREAWLVATKEAADAVGINPDDGWVLKSDATAFVKNGKTEPEKPDATDK